MQLASYESSRVAGFTLIELSIVLVIIGLIVGGVLVGQDLIRAAEVRATVSQIEKYNTAVETFYGKYGALPGDLNQAIATQFGFAIRGPYDGEGDGNGVIEGNNCNSMGCGNGTGEGAGETAMFWVDLSSVNLIEGTFNTASSQVFPIPGGIVSGTGLNLYFPQAKLGRGNYIYVWSGGTIPQNNGINYYGISNISVLSPPGSCTGICSTPGLTVAQAYGIDKKMDDGYPQSGHVTATYLAQAALFGRYAGDWAAGGGSEGVNSGTPNYGATTTATVGSATTCYDNGGGSSAQTYSMEINSGAGVNCALSFQFQ